jgi:hypothetical protein
VGYSFSVPVDNVVSKETGASSRAILLDTAVAIGFLLMVYAVVLNWLVMPLRSDLFQRSWTGAKSILAVVGTGRTPVYAVFDSLNNNIIAYVRAPVRVIAIGDFARVQAPAFAFIAPPEAERVRQMRPDLAVIERAAIAIDTEASLYELRPK